MTYVFFAGQFGTAVDVEGGGSIEFGIGSIPGGLPAEDIVGAEVYQPGPEFFGYYGYITGAKGIDLVGEVLVGLTVVYTDVGGGVDDDFRTMLKTGVFQSIEVGDIHVRMGDRDNDVSLLKDLDEVGT